jgi:hypothetical protein
MYCLDDYSQVTLKNTIYGKLDHQMLRVTFQVAEDADYDTLHFHTVKLISQYMSNEYKDGVEIHKKGSKNFEHSHANGAMQTISVLYTFHQNQIQSSQNYFNPFQSIPDSFSS